jgi:predicted ATPase
VPLFVEELTKSILESGELREVGDRYGYSGPARAVTIPTTLRDSLMARLDRFMPVKEIAQIGAAIGRKFSYELIGAVAPLPHAHLDEASSNLAFTRGWHHKSKRVKPAFKHPFTKFLKRSAETTPSEGS